MEDNIGLVVATVPYLLPIGVVIGFVLVIAEIVFGPSSVTKEAQKRLYQRDMEEGKKHFDNAVQAEMKRIRKSST